MPLSEAFAQAQLDPTQRSFCLDSWQRIRLLAPAGSGKTYSLLWRCLALQGETTGGRFLLLTFTKAARDELRARLQTVEAFAPLGPAVEVSTLNSWGYRWLKQRLTQPKLVTSTQDRFFCMMNVLRPVWEHHSRISEVLSDSRRNSRAARQLMDLMDQVKGMGFRHDVHDRVDTFSTHLGWLVSNGMQGQAGALHRGLRDLEIVRSDDPETMIWEAHEHYFAFWRESTAHAYKAGILTLEDQKYWALMELERLIGQGQSEARFDRYRAIFVDEFQDINTLDLNLLKALARMSRCELTIVGDDDQAIFEWRGATPQFVLEPDRHIGPGYKTHILEVNYRSPRNIVDLSQQLIQHNRRRVPKRVHAGNASDARLVVRAMNTLQDSVAYVHQEVRRLLNLKPMRRIAIIGRKRSQIIPYQIVFAADGIHFCAAEDLNVLLSGAFDELKAILLLKGQASQPMPYGPDPVEAMLRFCDKIKRYPLNKTDRGSLKAHLAGARPRSIDQALEVLYGYRGPLKGKNADGEMSGSFYRAIRSVLQTKSVAETIKSLSEEFEGLQKDYGKSLEDIFYADPPFLYLAEYAARYGDDLGSFYTDVEAAIASLSQPPEQVGDEPDPVWNRPLHLMTALRAKGKEFDDVFILDCNQGIWPSKLAITEDEREAERRVFYVAVTRARQSLTILANRRLFDEVAMPSQYLAEMGLSVR